MNKEKLRELLLRTGIDIDELQLEKFERYFYELLLWNEKCNLTTITEEHEVIIKHFYDSLLIMSLKDWNAGGRLVDIGTGAGFPGIPIKIMNKDINITLMDSLNKRVNFLKHIIGVLELSKIDAIHARAEEMGQDKRWRENFDIAVSRAVAKMPVLLEYCLPLLRKGGIFVAFKGADIEEELNSAKNALQVLGGTIKAVEKMELPEHSGSRSLVVIEKIGPTPKMYPRKAGMAEKKPL